MEKIGDEVHMSGEEASSGATLHVMRYVLAISLALAVGAMSAIWITGALNQQPRQGDPVTAEEHALGG